MPETSKKRPSQDVTMFTNTQNDRVWCRRNPGLMRETESVLGYEAQDRRGARIFSHLRAQLHVNSFLHAVSRICGRYGKDVAKISPPKVCADVDGLHFPRVPRKTHHHQPSNQTRVHIKTAHRIGVQKSTACQGATKRTFTA